MAPLQAPELAFPAALKFTLASCKAGFYNDN